MSSVLNVEIELPKDGEFVAALGAARLALMAQTGEAPEDVLHPPQIGTRIKPDPAFKDQFDTAYPAFRDMYHRLKTL